MARLPRVNVWQHRNGIYYLRYTFLGERRMTSTRTSDRGKAELQKRRYEEILLNGRDPELELERVQRFEAARSTALRDIWPEIERRHLRDKAENTRKLYRINFDNLARCRVNGTPLTDIPMREISRQMILNYRDMLLEKGLKPSTVNRDVQFLKAALNLAVEWEYLEFNPIARLKALQEKNRRDVSNIRMEQVAALLDSLSSVVADICEFAYYSWRRREEILSLRIENVREVEIPAKHHVARYFVKGGKWAEFPLSGEAVRIFRRNKGGRTEGYVFLNPGTSDRYYHVGYTVARHVRKLQMKIATGEYFCFHDLRRLAATDASRRGYSNEEIAEGLGHSRRGVTGRYTPGRRAPLEMFEGQTKIRKIEKQACKEG